MGLASRAVGLFSRYGGYGLSLMSLLSGSTQDWNTQAGPRYDNSGVMAIIQYLNGGIESGPRLIVQKPVRGTRGREWKEIDNHELPRTVANGYRMTESQLNAGAILSLVVRGDAYWVASRSNSGKVLGYIYLPHWQVCPKNDEDYGGRRAGEFPVTYYEILDGDGHPQKFAVEDVIHFRWGIDPANPGRGLSPLWAALREIVSDNEAATLMAAMLQNGGVLGWAISPKQLNDDAFEVTPDQMRDQARMLQTFVTGDMAGTPAPVPFPIEVTQLGFEPSKLVLDKQRQIAIERILAQYGIDPMVLGLPSQSKTFSNFEEANEAAVRRALLRVLGIMAKTLTEQSLRVHYRTNSQAFSEERVYWDLSEVIALQPDAAAEREQGGKDWDRGLIKRSEWREQNGFDVDPERDEVYKEELGMMIAEHSASLQKPKDPAAEKKSKLARAKEKRAALAATIDPPEEDA